VKGTLRFDPEHPEHAGVSVVIDAKNLWTGEPDRDAHLRSADFLDVVNHPEIRFDGTRVEVLGGSDYLVHGDLTIRGVTRDAALRVRYLGQWQTPWWEGNVDKGPKTRAGFVATAEIDRRSYGASWNAPLDKGGFVVGHTVEITIDAEAILDG
jgi:polyisoprenoid-binding protein YceI